MDATTCLESETRADDPAATDPQAFRNGMRLLASGCSIIAAGDGESRAGLTATAVCSICADPPRLLVCVNRKTRAHAVIERSGRLSVNLLAEQHDTLARRFAGMADGVYADDRFLEGAWTEGSEGTPVLGDALASFECRVVQAMNAGSHSMFLCEVAQVRRPEEPARPLLYFDCHFGLLA
ncbi:MAG: flavin reductase family protein [Pseudomonadota bacterium]